MEQIAMVRSVREDGMAQVAVQRETACGAAHSCADCAGCEKDDDTDREHGPGL